MNSRKNRAGFSLVELMIVLGSVIILATIAVPSFINKRREKQRTQCARNIQSMENITRIWAIEHELRFTNRVVETDIIGPDKYIQSNLVCSAGGIYIFGTVRNPVKCSIAEHNLAGNAALAK